MGIRNGSDTWENLTASCKVKHALYNLVFSQTYPREMTTYIHTKICTEMCRVALFILFKNWGTQIFLTEEWINTLIYPYNGLIVTQQQKGTKPQIPHNNVGETHMHYAMWKQPVSKGYIMYDSTYLTFWKKQSLERDWKQISGYQGLGQSEGIWG